MGATSLARQGTRRRKWISALLAGGVAATVVALALSYVWKGRRAAKTWSLPEALPTNVNQQAAEYSFTRSVEGRQIFTVRAARTVAFKQGGKTLLEDVVVEFFGREGNRRDILRTRQCEYNAETGDLSSPGDVEVELNASVPATAAGYSKGESSARGGRVPIAVKTSRLSFVQQGSLAVTRAPVRFQIGQASGSARGMKYATREGWLELERDVALEMPLRGGGAGGVEPVPVRLVANRLRYESPPGDRPWVRLDGPIQIVWASWQALAGRGSVFLSEQNRVRAVVLEGGVHASESSAAGRLEARAERVRGDFDPITGELRQILGEGKVVAQSRRGGQERGLGRLEAKQVELNFKGRHPEPLGGRAWGDVLLTLSSYETGRAQAARRAQRGKLEDKNLSAAELRFTFAPGGRSLAMMQTVGPGKWTVIPVDGELGAREITAGQFLMTFDAHSRLKNLRGLSPTRIVFHPSRHAPPGTPPQESSSEWLNADLDPFTQTLEQVEQAGDYSFREGDRRATAERANYSARAQVLVLTGRPQLSDPYTRVSAERVRFDLRAGVAEGVGQLQSVHFGTSEPTGKNEADPLHIQAERMVAQRRSQFVRYEGKVRAWHGTDVVESPSLNVWRAERRVASGAWVRTSHFHPPANGPGRAGAPAREGEPQLVTIRADRLDYFDEGRKAGYRGNVQLQTQNTALRADRMDVYFSSSKLEPEASQIERAVAEGHVVVTQPARRATGEHAEYEAAAGQIRLTGGPPTLYDEKNGSTTGQGLTFYIRDDRLIVSGSEQLPAQSRHRVAQ